MIRPPAQRGPRFDFCDVDTVDGTETVLTLSFGRQMDAHEVLDALTDLVAQLHAGRAAAHDLERVENRAARRAARRRGAGGGHGSR